jgi:tRNA threonylcarbamoyladenosine biosynthesis protein TsaB
MIVLAIDTCEARGSVAVLKDDAVIRTIVRDTGEEYSSWLLPAVDRALESVAKGVADVDVFGVASGPGSFTGVRIGLTTVKAWSEVFGKPIVAMSRLEVLARQSETGAPYTASFIDAQRGLAFGALYKRTGDDLSLAGEEMVISPQAFVAWVASTVGAEQVVWVSTDASIVAEQPEWRARAERREEILSVDCVLAPMLGRLATQKALKGEVTDALSLDANYVRRSYVEVFRKNAPQNARDSRLGEGRPTIRTYTPADSEALFAICRRSPEAAQWSQESYGLAAASGQIVLVAETAGQIRGFLVARVAGGEAEILNMAVEVGQRRKSMGSMLLTAAVAAARTQEAQRIYLEVRESNQAAATFYEAHGFSKIGKRAKYYSGPTEDAVLMEKKLTG